MKKAFSVILVALFLFSCSFPSDNKSKYDPPEDHTVSKDGAKHKSGLKDPIENCVSCHGEDLRGGSSGVSCYECHGKKW